MSQALRIKVLGTTQTPVGVKKPSHYILPPSDFSYGYAPKKDAEGVSTVIRSWKVHQPSPTEHRPLDFLKENKKVGANKEKQGESNDSLPTDIRANNVGIRQRFCNSYLPPQEFIYGMPNRPSTPMKNVMNNKYANEAEKVMKREYEEYMKDKQKVRKLVPKKTKHYEQVLQFKKNSRVTEDKPLYKLKMFMDVGSKVTEGIKQFKTYHPLRKKNNVDNIIEKCQEEIKQAEVEENANRNHIVA